MTRQTIELPGPSGLAVRELGSYRFCVLQEDALIGSVGLHRSGKDGVIYYDIEREYRRQGFGTEVVGWFVKRVFENSNYGRLVARVNKDNLASQKLLLRLGFTMYKEQRRILNYERVRSA